MEVAYRAGVKDADDRRFVSVFFKEPQASEFELAVTAQIRNPLSANKSELSFERVGVGESREELLEVYDYSGDAIESIQAAKHPEWARVAISELPGRVSVGGKTGKAWRLVVRASAPADMDTERTGALVIRSASGSHEISVPLRITAEPFLRIIPRSIFQVNATAGQPMESRLSIIASKEAERLLAQPLIVEHDLGDRFQHRIEKKIGSDELQVVVTFTPKPGERSVKGEMKLRFGEDTRTFVIPFRCLVKP